MEANPVRSVLSTSGPSFHHTAESELRSPLAADRAGDPADENPAQKSYAGHLLAMILLWALVLILSSLALPTPLKGGDPVRHADDGATVQGVEATVPAAASVTRRTERTHSARRPAAAQMDYRAFLFLMKGMEGELARRSSRTAQPRSAMASLPTQQSVQESAKGAALHTVGTKE